jgi:hypothetical protein
MGFFKVVVGILVVGLVLAIAATQFLVVPPGGHYYLATTPAGGAPAYLTLSSGTPTGASSDVTGTVGFSTDKGQAAKLKMSSKSPVLMTGTTFMLADADLGMGLDSWAIQGKATLLGGGTPGQSTVFALGPPDATTVTGMAKKPVRLGTPMQLFALSGSDSGPSAAWQYVPSNDAGQQMVINGAGKFPAAWTLVPA